MKRVKNSAYLFQLVSYLFKIFDDVLMGQLLLFEGDFEASLVFPQLLFLLPVILLSKFEGTHIVSLQVRDVVLMLKQQVLHFLFIDLKKSFNVIT